MLFIDKSTFAYPYPTFSPNSPIESIGDSIFRLQDVNVRAILTSDLYESVLEQYSTMRLPTAIITGATTQIDFDNSVDIEVGASFILSGLTGTISAMNGTRVFVTSVLSSTSVIVSYNSTGKTWDSGGKITSFLSEDNYLLYQKIEPYLVYAAYADWLHTGKIKTTASGAMIHKIGEGEHLDSKIIGEASNKYAGFAEDYANRLRDFLNKEADKYPDYKPKIEIGAKSGQSTSIGFRLRNRRM
ncbi:MAG: hypothetical protein ACRCXN_13055 [Bacteroidales bacterium]